jgi:hypothetical protein
MVGRWLEVMVGPGIGSGKGCPPEEATGRIGPIGMFSLNPLDPLVRCCRDAIGKISELHRWLVASPQWFYILLKTI